MCQRECLGYGLKVHWIANLGLTARSIVMNS